MNSDEVVAYVDDVEVYASVFREGDFEWHKDSYYGWQLDVIRNPVFVGFYVYNEEGYAVGATDQQVVEAERLMLNEYWEKILYEGII